MIVVEKFKPKAQIKSLDELTYADALVIGLGQCFALIPGVSRSGATMVTGMLRKVDVKTSADFSFLISVPVISAATIYEFLKVYSQFTSDDLLQLLVGFVVSFLIAIVGIKGFLVVLKRLSITPFAIYRIIFGIVYYLLMK
jgi:undecaprenyl-diphosphatase